MKFVVVFDAMVFIQGLANPDGPSGACLSLLDKREIELLICPSVLAEIADVISRSRIRERFPRLSESSAAAFLEWLRLNSSQVEEPPATLHVDRDPKDSKYLNLAHSNGARFLVTRDKDLLELTNKPADLLIVTPPDFLLWVSE